MKMNTDALKALELKLTEYSKANGAIAEYESANTNYCACSGNCMGTCYGSMKTGCGTCQHACYGTCYRTCDKNAM